MIQIQTQMLTTNHARMLEVGLNKTFGDICILHIKQIGSVNQIIHGKTNYFNLTNQGKYKLPSCKM